MIALSLDKGRLFCPLLRARWHRTDQQERSISPRRQHIHVWRQNGASYGSDIERSRSPQTRGSIQRHRLFHDAAVLAVGRPASADGWQSKQCEGVRQCSEHIDR